MRDIALIVSIGTYTVLTLGLQVPEEIAIMMEDNKEIKLRVMVKPKDKEDGIDN